LQFVSFVFKTKKTKPKDLTLPIVIKMLSLIDMIKRGHEQFVMFAEKKKKKTILMKKGKFFQAKKAFIFFKTEMDISIFHDEGFNLNVAPDMAYSKFSHNYKL